MVKYLIIITSLLNVYLYMTVAKDFSLNLFKAYFSVFRVKLLSNFGTIFLLYPKQIQITYTNYTQKRSKNSFNHNWT